MIRHIVLWKIKEMAEGKTKAENLKLMKKSLSSLTTLPMVKELEVGINADEADKGNYDISLSTAFESMEDLAAYQEHPDHKMVASYIAKIRQERTCIDYKF